MKKPVVVDTNVLLVASEKARRANASCVQSCSDRLFSIRKQGVLTVDSGFRIIKEYKNKNSPTGEPGLGDEFLLWVLTNWTNPDYCDVVEITSRNDSDDDFLEFPDDPELATFDRSDRKFVAVARASQHRPTILNATDSDWWVHREVLEKHGVAIEFLCPDQFKPS